jgi:DUF1707 SHOCT-like domain
VSTQQTQPSPARTDDRPAGGGPPTRASDADRDRAADRLNAAFAEGRLTAGEHGERLEAAYAARTWQQLSQLTVDLPAPAGPVADPAAVPGTVSDADRCLMCVLLIVCPPAAIAWWLLSRRRPHAQDH